MSHNRYGHTIAEVELDAQELVEMSSSHETARRAPLAPELESFHIASDEEFAALGTPLSPENAVTVIRAPRHGLLNNRALGVFGLVLIASAAVVAHQVSSSERAAEPVNIAWTPLPAAPSEDALVEEEEVVAPQPTLFANPFDPTEVFELAPGLTKEEAREQVAQILLERARERMASR